MSLNSYLIKNIKKLNLVDIALMKWSYFALGLALIVAYPKAQVIDWWVYLILTLAAGECLWIEMFFSGSKKKGLWGKAEAWMKKIQLPDLYLLFFSMIFFAGFLAVLIPDLLDIRWTSYLIGSVVLGFRPWMRVVRK